MSHPDPTFDPTGDVYPDDEYIAESLMEDTALEESLADQAGLAVGKDESGLPEYIGNNKQWNEFERLKEQHDL